ncbi:tol-pal system-associated acyl-CoA thioesterase [Shewanella sp. YIC-542]|uniref:tol-pal system-associated acyl-CoA thioesterase n=1 Tax=Shewanella mytili TaxID=3377111 RepID=UPI00398ED121
MFRWPITVYYEDTDAGGVVYHANYLKFFERARSEWLRAMGVCQSTLLQADLAFLVRRAELDFSRAARFEQQLWVESRITELKRASLVFEQQLVDDKGVCYCSASVKIAAVSLSRMKPQAIPEPILQEFKKGER